MAKRRSGRSQSKDPATPTEAKRLSKKASDLGKKASQYYLSGDIAKDAGKAALGGAKYYLSGDIAKDYLSGDIVKRPVSKIAKGAKRLAKNMRGGGRVENGPDITDARGSGAARPQKFRKNG